jgi:hypothetical protein
MFWASGAGSVADRIRSPRAVARARRSGVRLPSAWRADRFFWIRVSSSPLPATLDRPASAPLLRAADRCHLTPWGTSRAGRSALQRGSSGAGVCAWVRRRQMAFDREPTPWRGSPVVCVSSFRSILFRCDVRATSADAGLQGRVVAPDWSVRGSRDPGSSALVKDVEAAREAPPAAVAYCVRKLSSGSSEHR